MDAGQTTAWGVRGGPQKEGGGAPEEEEEDDNDNSDGGCLGSAWAKW
jgi:hypothetical protein